MLHGSRTVFVFCQMNFIGIISCHFKG